MRSMKGRKRKWEEIDQELKQKKEMFVKLTRQVTDDSDAKINEKIQDIDAEFDDFKLCSDSMTQSIALNPSQKKPKYTMYKSDDEFWIHIPNNGRIARNTINQLPKQVTTLSLLGNLGEHLVICQDEQCQKQRKKQQEQILALKNEIASLSSDLNDQHELIVTLKQQIKQLRRYENDERL